ncbi:MAG: ECF transporter S component [Lachnospiraceae bacterium]|nr:ECF transporter S component [Lachnospiraceae bacterium]
MENLSKLMDVARSNIGFLLICVGIIAAVILSAYAAEAAIAKKRGVPRKNSKLKVRRLTIIAMLSAISIVLMLFEIPLGFLPSFYKIDLSELPVIIGAFTLGPVAGVVIEFVKIFLNLLITGTQTMFVGELANFLIGCAFVIPASFIYYMKKGKKSAIIGLATGTVVMVVAGCVLNAFVLLPKYAEVFQMPLDALIEMGTEKNAGIKGMFTFVVLAVAPFNLIKGSAVSIITVAIYKKISHILKGE